MKTARKVLKKHMRHGNPHSRQDFINNIDLYVFLPHVLGAMEEHASERTKELEKEVERLSQRLALCAKENADRFNENARLREALEELRHEAYDLREHCQDRGYIDFSDDDIDGVASFNKAMDKSESALSSVEENKQNHGITK